MLLRVTRVTLCMPVVYLGCWTDSPCSGYKFYWQDAKANGEKCGYGDEKEEQSERELCRDDMAIACFPVIVQRYIGCRARRTPWIYHSPTWKKPGSICLRAEWGCSKCGLRGKILPASAGGQDECLEISQEQQPQTFAKIQNNWAINLVYCCLFSCNSAHKQKLTVEKQ